DVGVCEGMQQGRLSESFDGGRFSPVMDGGVHLFHAWIARNMSEVAGAAEAARWTEWRGGGGAAAGRGDGPPPVGCPPAAPGRGTGAPGILPPAPPRGR